MHMLYTHSANGPRKKSLNFIFPTKYVIPKSLKFSHWLSEYKYAAFEISKLGAWFYQTRKKIGELNIYKI